MKYPNFFVDTSAYKVGRYPPDLVAYLRTNGRRKVLFGSQPPVLAGLDQLGLDDEAERLFLFKNANRVFRLGL